MELELNPYDEREEFEVPLLELPARVEARVGSVPAGGEPVAANLFDDDLRMITTRPSECAENIASTRSSCCARLGPAVLVVV